MIPDEAGQRLYTIASRGYDASGVGSEVWLGDGMLGVAAERRTIVRTTSMTRDVVFSRAVRSSIEQPRLDETSSCQISRTTSRPG
jgi:hypothetical protein